MPLSEDVAPAIWQLGSAFYFAPETLATGKELGLDGFRFYFLGRGGVLGDVEAPVVGSAFGYFAPSLVARTWSSARARAAAGPRAVAKAHLACAHRLGRERFGDLDLDGWCRAASAVVAAAEPAALALFSGFLAEPEPEDLEARAAHLCVQLRELRGSVHLVAIRASGLDPRTAHYIHRPEHYSLFGWPEGSEPVVTDDDRRSYEAAAELTERLLAPAFGVLDPSGAEELAGLLPAMVATVA